jgi:HEPN domain-containing protein
MSEPEHILEAKRWLEYAREDLQTAKLILDHPTIAYRHICGLSQQATEKALKAALIFLKIEFPRTHDLDVLRNRIPSDWELKQSFPDLAALTEWAVESRYPGDWPEANQSDAESAFNQAGQILQTILTDFEKRGIKP